MPELETLASPVRAVYKRMLLHARRLPDGDRQGALVKIRTAFRAHRSEANSERCGSRAGSSFLRRRTSFWTRRDDTKYIKRGACLTEKQAGDPTGELMRRSTATAATLSPRIRELLATAQSKLSYLKIITPRVTEDADGEGNGGKRRYVIRDGHVVEVDQTSSAGSSKFGGSSTVKNWGPGNMDADSLRRHESLMQRYRFENRPGGIPNSPLR